MIQPDHGTCARTVAESEGSEVFWQTPGTSAAYSSPVREGCVDVRARRKNRERGASLVELALILPVFALLVFGTVDLARAYRLDIRLEAAAREGAGFAQVQPNDVRNCPGQLNDIFDVALAEEPDATFSVRVLDEGGISLAETCRSANPTLTAQIASGEALTVEAQADFDVLTPLVQNLVGNTIRMSRTAEVRAQ